MKTKSTSQLRLVEIKTLAVETLGTQSKAEHWLNTINLALGDTPLSFAKSESGAIEIKKVLSVRNPSVVYSIFMENTVNEHSQKYPRHALCAARNMAALSNGSME